MVLATGCVRDEGTSTQYIGASFPAVPDLQLTAALHNSLQGARESRWLAGIVHCKDAYYLEHANRQLIPEAASLRWNALRRAGVVATEMESSTLFVLGSLRRLRTASLLIAVESKLAPIAFAATLDEAVNILSEVLANLDAPTIHKAMHPIEPRDSFLESGNDGGGER
jgi:uridine phosphorylase